MTAPTARHPPASSPPSAPQAQAQAHRQAHHRRKARAKAKGEALRWREAAHVEALPVQHPHAAGIDIGSRSHWVCVGSTTEAAVQDEGWGCPSRKAQRCSRRVV
jgi:hypothetical protein